MHSSFKRSLPIFLLLEPQLHKHKLLQAIPRSAKMMMELSLPFAKPI
jgi:hypothetical protein